MGRDLSASCLLFVDFISLCRVNIHALGFSARNLKFMRRFAEAYPEEPIVQGLLAQITWYHNITILDKVKDTVARDFYIRAAIQYGWSRIKNNTSRVNILVDRKQGTMLLALLEAFLHLRLRPCYERKVPLPPSARYAPEKAH